MTIDKQALRERYSEKPAPKCHICGSVMTIQRAGSGGVVYGCTGRIDKDGEGYKFADGRDFADDHYARSRVTDANESDPDVIALLDELEAKDKQIAEHNFENRLLANADRDIKALRQRIAELEGQLTSLFERVSGENVLAYPDGAINWLVDTIEGELDASEGALKNALRRIAELQSVNDELTKFPDQIVSYVARLGTSEIGGHTKNVIYSAAQKVKDRAAGIGKGE